MWNLLKKYLWMSLALQACVEKTGNEGETHRLSSKEKVLGAAVNKESHADCLLRHKRTHHNWFPWKSATVNNASYCQLLR